MKVCPHCAEEIHDAAVVCEHCKRDIPTPEADAYAVARASVVRFGGIALGGMVGLLVIGFIIGRVGPSARSHRSTGTCALHARATVVSHLSPIAKEAGWSTDVLAIRNMDDADWQDLHVTIFGFGQNKVSSKHPTGAYRLMKRVEGHEKLMVFELNDFQKSDGARWESLVMTVTDIDLRASMNGESCTAETQPDASPMFLTRAPWPAR